MNDLKGTKTLENLQAAFKGEAQGTNEYIFYASKAKKEGFVQISDIFTKVAHEEAAHAKLWLEAAAGIGTTEENLLAAVEGENYEATKMYIEMAETARQEGFTDIALKFESVAAIEGAHEKMFRALSANVNEGKVFERDEEVIWKCSNCGYEYSGRKAPEKCPACAHPKAYFQIKPVNY